MASTVRDAVKPTRTILWVIRSKIVYSTIYWNNMEHNELSIINKCYMYTEGIKSESPSRILLIDYYEYCVSM
jgi:hypothetical protein